MSLISEGRYDACTWAPALSISIESAPIQSAEGAFASMSTLLVFTKVDNPLSNLFECRYEIHAAEIRAEKTSSATTLRYRCTVIISQPDMLAMPSCAQYR